MKKIYHIIIILLIFVITSIGGFIIYRNTTNDKSKDSQVIVPKKQDNSQDNDIIKEKLSLNGLTAISYSNASRNWLVLVNNNNKEIVVDSDNNENLGFRAEFSNLKFSGNGKYLMYRTQARELNKGTVYNFDVDKKEEFYGVETLEFIDDGNYLLACATSDIADMHYGDIYQLSSFKKIYSIPENKGNDCNYDKDRRIVTFRIYKDLWTGKVEDIKSIIEYDIKANEYKEVFLSISQDEKNRLLLKASKDGDLGKVKELIKEGADVNKAYDGDTAMIRSAVIGSVSIIRELIKAGADINYKDKNGEVALVIALGNGHIEAAKELIKAGADTNQKDKSGSTVLDIAWRGNYVDILEQLNEINLDDLKSTEDGYIL